MIDNLDAAISGSSFRSPVVGYRGVADADFIPGWNQVDVIGMEWTEWGYASISTERLIAEGFAGRGVIMRVVTPTRQDALRLSGREFESELLLPRGSTFRVVADHGVDEQGRRIIDVEVVQ